MPAKRYVVLILTATVGSILIAACGGDQAAFRGTVVAPLETISALTPGAALFATLTAEPAITQAPAEARPATPTPRPPTATPRAATPTPRPPTATARPDTPTPLSPPEAPIPTIGPETYLDITQKVGSSGDAWTLADIRVGLHPKRVRIVWEMGERRDAAPLTEIVEVDNTKTAFPRRGSLLDPSWGAARIDVMVSDCYAYGVPLNDMLPITMSNSQLVTKVGVHPTFDDALLGFSIGLSKPAAYEVFTLTDPVRIVIDVITQP